NGPVMAPSSTAAGGNGVYAYGSTSVFPSDSFGATNYWVDVTFDSLGGGNHNPVAGADTGYSTPMGTPITIAVASLLANDSDADGDALTITAVSAANNGTVSLDAVNGTITYTPNAGF